MPTALVPGTFNPFTLGHKSLVDRALEIFDRVVVAVGVNDEKHAADAQARVPLISSYFASEPRVQVISYTGLTVDTCRRCGAVAMVRGIRTVTDFDYEMRLADANRNISGIETVVFYTLPQYAWLSSSVVRELAAHGVDVSPYLPKPVESDNK